MSQLRVLDQVDSSHGRVAIHLRHERPGSFDGSRAMPVLAQVFLLLQDAESIEDFVDVARVLGRAFANRRDGQLLKQDLLLGRFFEGPDSAERRATSFLGTLRAIDSQDLLMTLPDVGQLVDVFGDVARDPSVLTAVLGLRRNADLSEVVESCLHHSVELVSLNDLAALPVSDQLALELATLRPQLLRKREFWSTHASGRTLLLRSLVHDAESVPCFIEVFADTFDALELELLVERNPEAIISNIAMRWQRNAVPLDISRMIVHELGRFGDLLPRLVGRADSLPRPIWEDVGLALAAGPQRLGRRSCLGPDSNERTCYPDRAV
ncbi:hypothetical protein [Burkholderia ambifaria]|uniref:hypothetical protein n=1 Tax=Burkholderia ambifaria TaxID=152480 RepID=UPI00158CB645|nr:hypothetical protein [Burkholderia ambifaria]